MNLITTHQLAFWLSMVSWRPDLTTMQCCSDLFLQPFLYENYESKLDLYTQYTHDPLNYLPLSEALSNLL